MERGQKGPANETPRKTLDMKSAVLWVRRLTQLADAYTLMELPDVAKLLQRRALKVGVRIITLAAANGRAQQMLDATMERIRDRDGEMYTRIDDVLRQARAVKTTAEEIRT